MTLAKKLFYYSYTQTFKPEYKSKTKFDLIKKIPDFISKALYNKDFDLDMTIEYHKWAYGPFKDQSRADKPHLHGIIVVYDKDISQTNINSICRTLKLHGRMEFIPLEDEYSVTHWEEYILKEVLDNNAKYKFEHRFQKKYLNLQNLKNQIEEKEFEEEEIKLEKLNKEDYKKLQQRLKRETYVLPTDEQLKEVDQLIALEALIKEI
jgi:hypothetical protein